MTPLNALFDRSIFKSQDIGCRFYRDAYIYGFSKEHLALLRLWLANGLDVYKRNSQGELVSLQCASELTSHEGMSYYRDGDESVECLRAAHKLLNVEDPDPAYTAQRKNDRGIYSVHIDED